MAETRHRRQATTRAIRMMFATDRIRAKPMSAARCRSFGSACSLSSVIVTRVLYPLASQLPCTCLRRAQTGVDARRPAPRRVAQDRREVLGGGDKAAVDCKLWAELGAGPGCRLLARPPAVEVHHTPRGRSTGGSPNSTHSHPTNQPIACEEVELESNERSSGVVQRRRRHHCHRIRQH